MNKSISALLARIPIILKLRKVFLRYQRGMSYFRPKVKRVRKWALQDSEFSNYYYSLTDKNLHELHCLLVAISKEDPSEIRRYIDEIHLNEQLQFELTRQIEFDGTRRLNPISFGRRIGWYALIRMLKPRLVVETGVHQGVGACVISEALQKNAIDGHVGRYVGTEINPNHGKLFKSNYSDTGEILYGDSITSLMNLTNGDVDIFINDSDHDSEYERKEYEVIGNKLSKNGIILGDNSHVTGSLLEYSILNGRKFLLFREEPFDHWYPGGGIGISIPNIPLRPFQ